MWRPHWRLTILDSESFEPRATYYAEHKDDLRPQRDKACKVGCHVLFEELIRRGTVWAPRGDELTNDNRGPDVYVGRIRL